MLGKFGSKTRLQRAKYPLVKRNFVILMNNYRAFKTFGKRTYDLRNKIRKDQTCATSQRFS